LYLKLKRCRVVDPSTGRDDVVDIGVKDGFVDVIGEVKESTADKVLDVKQQYATPALVDLHTHVYHLGTSLGVNADQIAKSSGVGVFIDAGSAGAGNFAGFRKYVIEKSGSTIYSFLNVGYGGIPFFGIQKNSQASEISDIRVADEVACVDCVRKNRDRIVGIKVRLSKNANGELGVEPLVAAKRCAKKLGVPVMVHFGWPPPFVDDVVELLERGDILTHSFRPYPNSILAEKGGSRERVHKKLRNARRRGVVIDIGHGSGSFSFDVAKAALADGFFPDTISTDVHALSIKEPVHDLETTMTKFLALGMPMREIIRSVTYTPAKAIGRPMHGVISPGSPADMVIIGVARKRAVLRDATGKRLLFDRMIRPLLRVIGKETVSMARTGRV
jgi:dihydroorotase